VEHSRLIDGHVDNKNLVFTLFDVNHVDFLSCITKIPSLDIFYFAPSCNIIPDLITHSLKSCCCCCCYSILRLLHEVIVTMYNRYVLLAQVFTHSTCIKCFNMIQTVFCLNLSDQDYITWLYLYVYTTVLESAYNSPPVSIGSITRRNMTGVWCHVVDTVRRTPPAR
jgi:hypothetical protein